MDFPDRSVNYATFVRDLAAQVVAQLKRIEQDPPFLSQRRAWQLFGKSNVQRWVDTEKITPHKRPGRIEYCTADLRRLQNVAQDYF